ncbi:hypothetical protein Taro_007201 [Colocasia esculenta]|uniref:Uncharacterized protein n=1 Tax=Colocasia esculenta TaxID=4460 RepID=A0A843TXG2_COLES|nr:hypothetical protein [Colocasia esculenta]
MCVASSTTPTVVTSLVGCPRFSVSQVVSSGLCPGTCAVPSRSVSSVLDTLTPLFEFVVYCFRTCVLVCSVLGEFPTEPVTREAHPYPPTGEGEEDVSLPSSSSEPRRSGIGPAPPAV